MQRRRTLLISDAGALFGSKACQSAAVSQWSCLVQGWAAPFVLQFSNTPALNAARSSPIGCAPPCAGACGGAPEATLRRWRNTQPWQHIHRCAIPLDVRRARVAAHQTCQAHAGVGYAALATCSSGWHLDVGGIHNLVSMCTRRLSQTSLEYAALASKFTRRGADPSTFAACR